MRSCIFIDGENLRHSIVDLFEKEFDPADYLPKRARWQDFFDFLAAQCYVSTRLRTYWYVVEHIEFWPWKLPFDDPATLIKVVSKHEPFENQLKTAPKPDELAKVLANGLNAERNKMQRRFDGWHTVQNGIAGQHDAVEFRRAGIIRYDLFWRRFGKEKAVDVKLAVDLLELADIYDVAIIVSGDGDYVPAVQAVKDRGKRVVNVSFETRSGDLLPGGARTLNQITDRVLIVKYGQTKDFLLPP